MAYEKIHESIDFKDRQAPSITADVLNSREATFEELDNRTVELSIFNESVPETYTTKEEVSSTYATQNDLSTEMMNQYRNIMGQVVEIAEDFSNEAASGKADVILANASGTLIHVEDSSESNSVEFKLIGADGSVEVKSFGKNLLKNTATSKTFNGVSFTVNKDGSVTANGTATATCQLYYDFTANISVDDLILSGCPSGGTFSNYWLTLSDRTESKNYIDYGNGAECSLVKGNTYRVVFVIYNGQTVSDFTFYPMISVEGGEYEPYKESTTTINADESTEAKVKFFYPVTNILNDANCGMEVTYKADTRNYIDRIIGERISAIETALINNI